MSVEALTTALADIRVRLERGEYSDEAKVSNGIVRRVLDTLGWPVYDPSVVIPEYAVRSRKVDFALVGPDRKPAILLEVKRVGNIEIGEDQLFQYAFTEGTPVIVLTDGQQWRLYLTGAGGTYSSRCFYGADLLSVPPDIVAHFLSRYLDYDEVSADDAVRRAWDDLKAAKKQNKARETLPEAWRAVAQSAALVTLMRERVEAICGVCPSEEATTLFLGELRREPASSPAPVVRPPSAPVRRARPAPAPDPRVEPSGCWFEIRGRRTACESQIHLVREVLLHLHKEDATFLVRFADAQPEGKRLLIARDRKALYPGTPHRSTDSIELVEGWWLGRNYSRESKMTWLRRVSEVANLRWGTEFKVNAPTKVGVGATEDTSSPHGRYSFTLDRTTRRFATVVNLLVAVLTELRGRDATLYTRLSAKYRGKARKEIARRKADVYPGLPKLQPQIHALPDGWFVGTNTTSPQKIEMIREACGLVGLKFGRDLSVDIPIRRRKKKPS